MHSKGSPIPAVADSLNLSAFGSFSRWLKRRRSALCAITIAAIVSLPAMLAQTPKDTQPQAPKPPVIRPTVPDANPHEPGKVILVHADALKHDALRDTDNVQILVGNVQFRKGDMFMFCDSARFNEVSNSLDAFNNVHMEQGDTLFVYGDELYYNGQEEIAELRAHPGKVVKLINRDVRLETDVFFYDMYEDVGYYMTGGMLTDKTNNLKSLQGYYYPATKDAFFYLNVRLTGPRDNDTLRMFTDSLTYNTESGIARLLCPTLIVNKDGEIRSSSGYYDTRTSVADLYNRSEVKTRRGNTLIGDTLFYDRNAGYGEAFGNMILTDSGRQSSLSGDYGFYNELTDSSFVTGNALAMEYSSADTLYLHGDTINAYALPDSSRVTNAFRRVRFFRNDIQGLCDSMSIVERDSILYMYDHPIIWNGERQIAGNVVYVHFTDSTADWARLPETGMVAEHIAEDCYNQITGSDMTAWLNDTTLHRVYAEGNVQLIMFPMENDSTYNKFAFVESSYLDAGFNEGQMEKVKMWPETTGKVTPLYLAKRSAYYLPKFRWYEALRPLAPDDIFEYPEQMADLMSSTLLGVPKPESKKVRGTATGKPRPQVPQIPESAPQTISLPDSLSLDTVPVYNDTIPNYGEPQQFGRPGFEPEGDDNPETPADIPADNPVEEPATLPSTEENEENDTENNL